MIFHGKITDFHWITQDAYGKIAGTGILPLLSAGWGRFFLRLYAMWQSIVGLFGTGNNACLSSLKKKSLSLSNWLINHSFSVTLDRKATTLCRRAFHAIGWFSGNDLATVPFAMFCLVLLAKNSLCEQR